MSMRTIFSLGVLLVSAVSAFAAVGCGDDGKAKEKCPAETVANETVPGCSCGDAGTIGVQTCQMDGFLSECNCAGGAGVAGVTGGTAGTIGGTSGTGSTAGTGSGVSGVGGTEDDGGVPGGESGTGGGDTAGTGGSTKPEQPKADGTELAACDPLAADSCDGDLICYSAVGATTVGFCTATCTNDDDCTSLGAEFTCSTASGGGLPGGGGGTQSCRQTCTGEDDKSCPEFMSCMAVQGGFRCLYDEKDVGSGDKKIWEKCEVTGDCSGDLTCYPVIGSSAYQGFCTQPCTEAADCGTPTSGDVEPHCGSSRVCSLDCGSGSPIGDDKACPTGMVCGMIGVGPLAAKRCLYEATSSGGI
jgi:hypothetical protein